MKKNLSIFLVTTLTLSLTACGTTEDQGTQEPTETERAVTIYNIEPQEFQPVFRVSGNLTAKTESVIAAEASGTVKTISFKKGDVVKADDVLLVFDTADNSAKVNFDTAKTNLANANSLLDLTTQSATSSEKTAELAIEQAKINLETANKTNTSTDVSIDEQIKSLENAIDIATVSLKSAETNLANEKVNQTKTTEDLLQIADNAYAGILIDLNTSLQKSDEILGITDKNKHTNDDYEALLSARDPQLLPDAELLFKTTNTSIASLTQSFKNVETLTEADKLLQKAVEKAKDSRELLNMVDEILQNTITSKDFTNADLANLKSTIIARKSSLEAQISSLTSISQSISDYLIQAPQTITNLELAVESATKNLEQAKHNLSNTNASLDVSKVGTSAQVEIAEKSLSSAEAQLESVQKQSSIAIQNAQTNRDAAQKQYDSAQLAYEKLTVKSPIDGIVIEKSVEQGDTVNAGSPLFTIADINTLTLKGDLSAEEASKIQEGERANIFINDEQIKTRGVVRIISPIANIITRKVQIEIEINNKNNELFANTFARAELTSKEKEKVLTIPLNALFSKNPPTVFVVKDNYAEKRIVELGRQGEGIVEVVSGLEEGETIVSESTLELENGDKVKIVEKLEKKADAEATEEVKIPESIQKVMNLKIFPDFTTSTTKNTQETDQEDMQLDEQTDEQEDAQKADQENVIYKILQKDTDELE